MDIIHNSFDIVHKSEKSDFDLFFTMIPLGRYVTIRHARHRGGSVNTERKNEKESKA